MEASPHAAGGEPASRASGGVGAKRFRWDAADAAKLVMSIMVVAIHVPPFGRWGTAAILPALRLAVPLFFMISAYLFFRRLGPGASWPEARRALARFARRTGKLYFFWFLVLLAPTAVIRDWAFMPLPEVVASIALRIPLNATFLASWYLAASVVGLAIVVVLRYRFGVCRGALACLGLACYALALLSSCYSWLAGPLLPFIAARGTFVACNSFVVAVPWMGLGAAVASWERRGFAPPRRRLAFALGLGVAALYFEWAALHLLGVEMLQNDVLACLPLAALPAFLLLRGCDVELPRAGGMRMASTVVYCLHATLARVIAFAAAAAGADVPGLALFAATLALCLLAAAATRGLERRRGLRWLRWAH